MTLYRGISKMSDWRPGFRHQVKDTPPSGWECVDCGQWFEAWPSDLEECRGPEFRVQLAVSS
jgi:hypothetical protein